MRGSNVYHITSLQKRGGMGLLFCKPTININFNDCARTSTTAHSSALYHEERREEGKGGGVLTTDSRSQSLARDLSSQKPEVEQDPSCNDVYY